MNQAAVDGVLTAEVTAGLPVGVYRMASFIAAANHQSPLCPVSQRGAQDDIVYVSTFIIHTMCFSSYAIDWHSSLSSDFNVHFSKTPLVSVEHVSILLFIHIFAWYLREYSEQIPNHYQILTNI